jgi:hypothetical protein
MQLMPQKPISRQNLMLHNNGIAQARFVPALWMF